MVSPAQAWLHKSSANANNAVGKIKCGLTAAGTGGGAGGMHKEGLSEEGALAGDLNGGKEMPWDPWGGMGPRHCHTGFWNRKAPGMTEA